MATKHIKRRTPATTPAGVIDGYHEDLVEEDLAAMDSSGAGSAYYTFEVVEGVEVLLLHMIWSRMTDLCLVCDIHARRIREVIVW